MKLKLAGFSALLCVLIAFAPAIHADQTHDIFDTAFTAHKFKVLIAAIRAADLANALKGPGPYTVFAPDDAAFKKLEKAKPGTIAMLLKPENKAKLTAILTYHALKGRVMSADLLKLKNGSALKTLNGASVTIENKGGIKINNAKVIKADIIASNGVIHEIDTVLVPK
jgi:uncharacterized surface protein with fasciclin (FAS1) repeats